MPIYEYQCSACLQKTEKLQKIADESLKVCPSCHEPRLTRLVSAAGFRLKGGGWYETDFKSGKKKNLLNATSEKGSGEKGSGTSSSGTSSGDKTGGASGDSSTAAAG